METYGKFLWLHIMLESILFPNLHALDANLVQGYLRMKFANKANIFHCFNRRDEVSFMKSLPKDLTVRFLNVNGLNTSRSDVVAELNQKLGFIIDGVDCPYEETLRQLSEHKSFTDIHPTLLFLRRATLIESAFSNITLSISTDVQVMSEDYQVSDVYNPSTLHGGKLIWNRYAHWILEERIFRRTNRENIYWTRRNMSGLLFKTMYVFPQPFKGSLDDYVFDDTHREVNTFNRFHAVLTNHARDFYGYSLNRSRTTSWGFVQPNGRFDGLVGALERREIDFSGTPLFVKHDRIPFVDSGRKTWVLRSAFIFRSPKRLKSFEVFLRPLDSLVWYFIIVASILITAVLRLALKSETLKPKQEEADGFEASWSHIILFTLGALCQQGSATSPSAISARIVFIFTFIFMVLLYQYYSANIVAMLVMSPAKFIHNLYDLAFSTLVMGCEDIIYNHEYFTKQENDSVFARLMQKSPNGDRASFYADLEVGLQRVTEGGYAFHAEIATAYPFILKAFDEESICNLDEITVIQKGEHQGAEKGSPFLDMLNHVLHKTDESGLMSRQLKHWHARKPECIGSQSATSPVSIQEFYPALSLLLFGILISLIIFILELIKYNYERYKNDRNEPRREKIGVLHRF